jgi:hypothetical protein
LFNKKKNVKVDLRLNESDIWVGVDEEDAPIICPNRLLSNKIGRLPWPNWDVTADPLTTPINECPCLKSIICWANSIATRFWASRVFAPKWGVQITDGCWIRFKSTGGSSSKTSRPAPLHWPELRASSNAFSSIIPPRATFINLTPRRHNDNTSLLIKSISK